MKSNEFTKEGDSSTSVVLVGVGGQGILLSSAIVARTALEEGFDVKTNEIHGMAQRGGSVVAQIRYGKKVYSPLVPKGTASALVSLERTEGLRYADYLAPDGLAVVSDQVVVPVTVSSGLSTYPNLSEEELGKFFPRLVFVRAVDSAAKLGAVRAANTILLGALSTKLDFSVESWEDAIRQCVKPAFVDVNLSAFAVGRELVSM